MPPFFRNMNPPPPLHPLDTQHGKKPGSMMIHWKQGDWKKLMETYYLKKLRALSTECVLIDIIVTITIVVGTGCNFPHGKVGTKSHHIKTYHNRMTKSQLNHTCALSHQLLTNGTFREEIKITCLDGNKK